MLSNTQFPGRECINWQPARPETGEAYGQRYGHLVIFPTLRTRVVLYLGQLFITIGKKLIMESQGMPPLSKETA